MRKTTTISWLNVLIFVTVPACIAGEIWGSGTTSFLCTAVLFVEGFAHLIARASRKPPEADVPAGQLAPQLWRHGLTLSWIEIACLIGASFAFAGNYWGDLTVRRSCGPLAVAAIVLFAASFFTRWSRGQPRPPIHS